MALLCVNRKIEGVVYNQIYYEVNSNVEKVDYGKTLNLPQTEFPMRGNQPKKEPEML